MNDISADTLSHVGAAALTPDSVWLGLLLGLFTAFVYYRYCVPHGMEENIRSNTIRAFVHNVCAAASWAVVIVYFSALGLMVCGSVNEANLLVTTAICSLILFSASRYLSVRQGVRRDKEQR